MQLRNSRFFCLTRGVLLDNGVQPLWNTTNSRESIMTNSRASNDCATTIVTEVVTQTHVGFQPSRDLWEYEVTSRSNQKTLQMV